MNLLKNSFLLALCAWFFSFIACKPADESGIGDYSNGVLITCDGAFPSGTGFVSFYDRQGTTITDVFGKENGGAALGNTVQTMALYGGKAYIMVNNANKMVIVDAKTFKTPETVTGTNYPFQFLPIDANRAYVSEWGDKGTSGGVKVYDYVNKNFVKTISTKSYGAGKMLKFGASIWVINNSGLFYYDPSKPKVLPDSTVTIIDSDRDTILKTITVGYMPNSMVQDANGDVWVLSSGIGATGKLVKIRSGVIDLSFDVPAFSSKLTGDVTGSTLYFISGNKVYQKDLLNFAKTPPSVFLTQPYLSSPYALGFDPKTGYMYCGDAKNYSSNGTVYIFDPATKALKDSTKVGIAPNGFIFR